MRCVTSHIWYNFGDDNQKWKFLNNDYDYDYDYDCIQG